MDDKWTFRRRFASAKNALITSLLFVRRLPTTPLLNVFAGSRSTLWRWDESDSQDLAL